MPQKKNPDVIELTRARAALFPGWLSQVLALGQLPSGYHRDYQLTKGPLFAALDAMRQMLVIVGRLPEALTVDKARCGSAITEDMLATHKVMALVGSGTAFRDAYREVAAVARSSSGPQTAGSPGLPDYPGAPGNPDWESVLAERRDGEKRLAQRCARLHAAWKSLLS